MRLQNDKRWHLDPLTFQLVPFTKDSADKELMHTLINPSHLSSHGGKFMVYGRSLVFVDSMQTLTMSSEKIISVTLNERLSEVKHHLRTYRLHLVLGKSVTSYTVWKVKN